ncbi:Hypothetical predicted protein [Marmota monax]|uniref:Uncharacterized protein n=1 Tax=Marmota monax TaxID=9995 RepID=A0A5E4BDJ1_MARMO|nr:Hypothetical predicted protein [Marmota monax]
MSIQSPPTLLELAGRSLLSDKSRAILDLEDLPIELFPPLFVEAFSRGHTEVLKKMVQAWPFTCLPLGALMRKPQLEMLQVALDGLDMLLHKEWWEELYGQVLQIQDGPGLVTQQAVPCQLQQRGWGLDAHPDESERRRIPDNGPEKRSLSHPLPASGKGVLESPKTHPILKRENLCLFLCPYKMEIGMSCDLMQ